MMNEFKDKNICIAGASRGIGLEIARQLAEAGANLVLHASTVETTKSLKEIFGDYHYYFTADFSSPSEIKHAINQSVPQDFLLDGLVFCVGIRSRRPLNMLKPSHFTEVLNVNVISFSELVKVFSRKGRFNSGMSIIAISSISSQVGSSGITAYAASKAALDASVRCLAKELRKKEIRVNSIICGQVNTEAYDELMQSKEKQMDPVLERQYMGLASTGDIASITQFLLSKSSSFISGAQIPADGGYLN